MNKYTYVSGTVIDKIPAGTKFRVVDSMFRSNMGSYLIAMFYQHLTGDEVVKIVDDNFIQMATELPEWHSWVEDTRVVFRNSKGVEHRYHFSERHSSPTQLAVWREGCTSHSTSEFAVLTPEEIKSVLLYGTAPF